MTVALIGLNGFLARLDGDKVPYRLDHCRPDAVLVSVALPGQRWEIEFLDDGSVDVERFRSDGSIAGPEVLDEFFERLGA